MAKTAPWLGGELSLSLTEQLAALEEIRQLKARYWYHLDRQDWDGWRREVWAPDATLTVPGVREEPLAGVDTIIAWVSARFVGKISVHHGHPPQITLLSDTTAKGVWPMEDRLFNSPEQARASGFGILHGLGFYQERYVDGPVGWRISASRLDRIHLETTVQTPGAEATPPF